MNLPGELEIGVAGSAAAGEGAPHADARGESIWDRFTRGRAEAEAALALGSRGYEHALADAALLARLGMQGARFSIAWPRVQPNGRGRGNRAALDHYARLLDALLAAGVRPLPTLYSWDLPQALEEVGGWSAPDSAGRFADFAEIVARALGDRVAAWVAFERPSVFLREGYLTGRHAPGRSDAASYLRATHVVNLALAEAARAIRSARPAAAVGTAPAFHACIPASDRAADEAAAKRWLALDTEWHLAPALGGAYPDAFVEGVHTEQEGLREADAKRLRAPLDFVMLAAGPSWRVRFEAEPLGLNAEAERLDESPDRLADSLHSALSQFAARHPGLAIGFTLTGSAFESGGGADADGACRARLEAALSACLRAIGEGAAIRSFFAEPFLDGFDFDSGSTSCGGLVAVDPVSGARSVRGAGRWFSRVARARSDEPG